MTRRFSMFGRAFSVLLLAVVIAIPAVAQTSTALRPSSGGKLLPQGTEVIVLRKPAAVKKDSLFQPEFFPRSAYPLRRDLVLRRDSLDGAHRTRRTYPRSQSAGVVYFLYALAPDSTLYWSFSPPRDSLKFDVVNQGVMSVSPVTDPAVRREIVSAFFRRSVEEPVTVIMRNGTAGADSAEAVTETLPDDDATAEDGVAAADTSAAGLESADLGSTGSGATDSGATDSGGELAAMAAPPPRASGGTHYGAFFALFGVLLLLAAVPVYLMRRYHSELTATRMEILALRMQKLSTGAHPDHTGNLQQALEESERRREQAERAYEVLQARYQEMLRELDRGDVPS